MIYDMSGIILCGEERCTPPTENMFHPHFQMKLDSLIFSLHLAVTACIFFSVD